MSVAEKVLYGIRGDTNRWEFDLTGAIVAASDIFVFTAKVNSWDTDAAATTIQKALNHGTIPDAGIVVTSEGDGKFEVTLEPADTDDITQAAMVFDCQVYDDSESETITVAQGTLFLTGEVTEAA